MFNLRKAFTAPKKVVTEQERQTFSFGWSQRKTQPRVNLHKLSPGENSKRIISDGDDEDVGDEVRGARGMI